MSNSLTPEQQIMQIKIAYADTCMANVSMQKQLGLMTEAIKEKDAKISELKAEIGASKGEHELKITEQDC